MKADSVYQITGSTAQQMLCRFHTFFKAGFTSLSHGCRSYVIPTSPLRPIWCGTVDRDPRITMNTKDIVKTGHFNLRQLTQLSAE